MHRFVFSSVFLVLLALTVWGLSAMQVDTVFVHDISSLSDDGNIAVRISATSSIPTYQRPEQTRQGFIIRIPGARIQQGLPREGGDSNLKWTSEVIRDILVLRFTATVADTVSIRRNGPKELLLSYSQKKQPVANDQPTKLPTKQQGKWLLDVIVIDAGHGGPDAGAEGVNGTYEKDVTLAIARRIRDRLKIEMPKTKVIMTRDSDVFVELFKRTQIANDAGGKLFMSIHCNSMPLKPHPAHGCETYILRPGRNEDAARVASRENASVQFERSASPYKGMTEDQIIIATMAQRSFVRLSETLASGIQRSVTNATPLTDRGVNQAGFYVLVGASMPNVLVETGFLSNTTDAEYLSSSKGQMAIAEALVRAIQDYAVSYERSLSH